MFHAYTFRAGHPARWIYAGVAQLAEQLFRKQQVSSSSLLAGSLFIWAAFHRRSGNDWFCLSPGLGGQPSVMPPGPWLKAEPVC
jgi:hypothetical protein